MKKRYNDDEITNAHIGHHSVNISIVWNITQQVCLSTYTMNKQQMVCSKDTNNSPSMLTLFLFSWNIYFINCSSACYVWVDRLVTLLKNLELSIKFILYFLVKMSTCF